MTHWLTEPYCLTRSIPTTLEPPEVKTALKPSIRIPRILLLALLLAASAAGAEAQWSDERRSRRDFRGDFTERRDLRVTLPEAMAAMRPALDLAGDAGRGEESFLELCARCHRSGPLGGGPGPDLSRVAQWSVERVLRDIVDPNAEIDAEYASQSNGPSMMPEGLAAGLEAADIADLLAFLNR